MGLLSKILILVSCGTLLLHRTCLHSIRANMLSYIATHKDSWHGSPKGKLLLGAFEDEKRIQNIEEIQQLISKGANVNVLRKDDGFTPLHIACEKGNLRLVSLLLDTRDKIGLDVDKASKKDGRTPLYVASERGYADVVHMLLEDGKADIAKAVNIESGSTALYTASKNGHLKVAQLLLPMVQTLMAPVTKVAGSHFS